MKNWQKLDVLGRTFVLLAAAAQIFLVTPLSNFDFSVFWYEAMRNQGNLMELILEPEMDLDRLNRIKDDLYNSQNTNSRYSVFHQILQKFGTWGFAILFFLGSIMLI